MFSRPGSMSVLSRRLLLITVFGPLVGCSMNSLTTPSNAAANAMSGIAHGGPNPVVGATVNLYATTSGGYGAAPTLLGTAVTDTNGSFTFVAPKACTANQQAYVTANGGNPGSGTNANYLLMAALGPCANISSATSIWIDELTTVAAAYSLRPFTTVATTGGLPVVQIGAPANNNVATGACTISASNVTTSCTAAGLTHAFANALNLANSVSLPGSTPTGTAYTVTPANPSGIVPTALLNSLANSIEACVNSPGGTAGDGTPCGNLFSYTTPPVTAGAAPTNTLQAMLNVAQYPALTAANVTNLFNLATPISFYFPALTSAPTDYSMAIVYTGVTVPGTVGSITVSPIGSGYTTPPAVAFTGGAPATPAAATATLGLASLSFTPNTGTACTAPVVKFTGGTPVSAATATATASGGVITGVTITAAGSGYNSVPVVTFTGTGCTTGTATPSLGVVAVALTSAGAGYSSAPTISLTGGGGTGAVATAAYAATAFAAPYAIALDANDNLYVGSQNVVGTVGADGFLSAIGANGTSLFTSAPSLAYTAPRGVGIDSLQHAWVTSNNTTALEQFSTTSGTLLTHFATSGAPFGIAIDRANNVWVSAPAGQSQGVYEFAQANAYASASFAMPPVFVNVARGLAVDANQNIFGSGFIGTSASMNVFPNTGTPGAPVYGVTSGALSTAINGVSASPLAIDAAGNAWTASTTGITEVIPGYSGTPATLTSIAASAASPIADGQTGPLYNDIDGAGTIWLAVGSGVTQYVPGTAAVTTYSPCYAPNGGQTCGTSVSLSQRTAVDSTGAVWLTSLGNGRIYQILGTGTPTWPQLSLGAPGVMPQ